MTIYCVDNGEAYSDRKPLFDEARHRHGFPVAGHGEGRGSGRDRPPPGLHPQAVFAHRYEGAEAPVRIGDYVAGDDGAHAGMGPDGGRPHPLLMRRFARISRGCCRYTPCCNRQYRG